MAVESFVNDQVDAPVTMPGAVTPEEEEVGEPTVEVEFDYDDDGEPPARDNAGRFTKPDATDEPDLGDDPDEEDPRIAELRAQVDQLRRATIEATEVARRAVPTTPSVPDKPPHKWETLDLASPEGKRGLAENLEWQRARDLSDFRTVAQTDATAASATQRARGVLNTETMGAGYDYDSIIGKHVAPLKAQNPALNELFARMADPALAEYGIGMILEAIAANKGDAVKAFKRMKRAITAERTETEAITDKIRRATRDGAQRVRVAQKKGSPVTTQKLTAEAIEKMDPDVFMKTFGPRY